MLIWFILKDKGQLEGLKEVQKKLHHIPLKPPKKDDALLLRRLG